jgi:hypothetical protein
MLGSDLQALLTQMQAESAGQAQNVAHATPAAGQTQGGPHHHQHHHMDSTNPPDGAQVASQTVSTGTIAG